MVKRGFALLLIMLSFATSAAFGEAATRDQQMDRCNNKGDNVPLDDQVEACSEIIKSKYAEFRMSTAYYNRGNARSKKKEWALAIADYSEAARLEPTNASIWNNRAILYAQTEQFDLALADFSEAIRLDPQHPTAFGSRGLIYDTKGDKERAIADYRKALEVNPQDAETREALADLEKKSGVAPEPAGKSSSTPAASADVLIGRHKVRGTTPDGSSYRGKLDISIQDGVYLFRWYLTSGEIYDGRGRLEGETLTVEWGDPTPVIYKVQPNGVLRGTWGGGKGTETATPEKATIARNKKSGEGAASADARKNCERYDEADVKIQACTQLIAKNAKDLPDIYTRRGNGYRMKKDYDRAFADYDKAIELDPNYALAYHQRGFTHAGKSEHDRAIADFDKALQLRPDFIGTFEQRANSYSAKGDYDRAIADYDTALAREPGASDYLCGRADAFAKKGDNERAKADYQMAQKDPEAFTDCAEEGLARLAAAGPAGAAQQGAQETKCVAGAAAVASGEIIQINPPSGESGISIAVNDSENSSCDDTILLQFARNAAPPQACSVGNVAEATGRLVDDGEGYTIFDPADLRCSPPPRDDPPNCANGARAIVSGVIRSAKLSGNTSGPRSFNVSLRRWTQTGACSVGMIYLASEAADCVAGAQIEATGTVEEILGAVMTKVETFKCGAR